MGTNIVNKKVRHKTLGVGTVISQDRRYIKVMYENGEKEHNYLDAFKSFLEMVDDEVAQKEIDKEIHTDYEVEACKVKKEAEQIERWKKYDEENKKNKSITRNRSNGTAKKEFNERPNVAFKCTYCDGGKSATCVGFNGVCSDKVIKYNVAERVWCSQENCACKQYLNGEIKRWELEEEFEDWGVCSESAMMRDWAAYAGTYHHGDRAGQPIKLKNAKVNNLCVLTTREPYEPENMRFIFGVFMIDDTYEGDDYESGEVRAHPKYRLALTPKEAKKMLYWKYYKNKSNSDEAKWGSLLYRYLTNTEAMQILCDIVKLKEGTKDEKLAKEFLEAFSKHIRLAPENAGSPRGALT